jgi:hypothetical protein
MELFDVKRCFLDVKRWSCLKHYMWSVGMKEKTLQGKGKGTLKPIALQWQWRIYSKGPSKANALGSQTPLDRKRPWIANALGSQTPFDGKGPSMANAEPFQGKESIVPERTARSAVPGVSPGRGY